MVSPEDRLPLSFDKTAILEILAAVKKKDRHRRLFGAGFHQYDLNPPLPAGEVEAFETKHKITLPADYKYFITEVGNGGAGPFYGVFPLGEWGFNKVLHKFDEGDGGAARKLSEPFAHTEAWNLPESFWAQEPDPPPGTSAEDEERMQEAWDELVENEYFDPQITNGSLPICHRGCGLVQCLVVHGPQKGFVWNDDRADRGGLSPVRDANGRRMTFADWYLAWLQSARDDPLPPRRGRVRERWKANGIDEWVYGAAGCAGLMVGLFLAHGMGLRDSKIMLMVAVCVAIVAYQFVAALNWWLRMRRVDSNTDAENENRDES